MSIYNLNDTSEILFVETSPVFRLCQRLNRSTLDLVDNWIDDETYYNSIYSYGLPENVRQYVNSKQRGDASYSDLILYQSLSIKSPVRYLEVGVSVGKNFLQMIRGLDNALVVGLDIEDISPSLLRFLDLEESTAWQTMPSSKRTKESTSNVYRSNISSNRVQYIAGDVFDEQSWARVPKDCNLIFSDAFHSGDALMAEWRMMKKHGVLADEFVMFWDDLEIMDMINAFWKICEDARETFSSSNIHSSIQKYDGWLGGNEHKHGVGCLIVRNQT